MRDCRQPLPTSQKPRQEGPPFMASSLRPLQTDIARLTLRVVLGIVFFAHGWQKFFSYTIPGAQGAFAKMQIPAAQLVAPAVASLELVGGAVLVVGILA